MRTAKKIRDLRRPNWFKGSSLYELSEPKELSAHGFLTATRYVIVAVTPEAVDHGCAETTVFAANKNGKLFGGFWDRDSPNREDHWYVPKLGLDDGAEFEYCRIYGAYSHREALEKLGYKIERSC